MRAGADHVVVYTPHHALAVLAPFYVIFGLLLCSLRSTGGPLCLAQMQLSPWVVHFITLNWAVVGGACWVFTQAPVQTTLPYIFELVLALLWLVWCFF